VTPVAAAALADHPDPFVRHQVDPDQVRGAWVEGDATAVVATGHLPAGTGRVLTLLGPATAVHGLATSLAGTIERPWRLTAPADAADDLPPSWRHTDRWHWHWMLTTTAPAPATVDVVEVTSADEINALLDEGAPTAHARPGSRGVECWLGVREAGTLVAVGALVRQHDRTGHLRAVTVLPDARGRGLGRELSAALTRRALTDGSGVATLGVYTDNDPAVAIYRGLGYDVVHTFTSGPLADQITGQLTG